MGSHDTQENGTCATLVPLFDAKAEDLDLHKFQESFLNAKPLEAKNILHTASEAKVFKKNLQFCLLRIFVNHGGESFRQFKKDLERDQPVTADKIKLHQSDLCPLPAWNIDESTIIDNADVEAAINKELRLDNSKESAEYVRFMDGDQLSLARLRALELIRAGQEAGRNGYFWGTWVAGLFHGKIADTHGTLYNHWGTPNTGERNPESLWYHNTRLNRLPITLTSLLPFRVCRDLLFVSLYARSCDCLLLVSGCDSLDDYIKKYPDWTDLVKYAELILNRYANASVVDDLRWSRRCASVNSPDSAPTEGDMVFENAILFFRDALILREFTDSVKAGDSGRVVLVLKIWALSFHGNGRTKYAYEMLHLIHNLTKVWGEGIRNIVLQNWLLNPTGKPNSWVELDLVQEHLNYWIKVFYKAHGVNASWEWLHMISPCVNVLQKLSQNFNDALGSDQGSRHAAPDLTNDITTLMESLREHGVHTLKPGRILDSEDEAVKDCVAIGLHNLTDGTKNPLLDYNDAFQHLQRQRRMSPLSKDTMAPSPQTVAPPNEVLHPSCNMAPCNVNANVSVVPSCLVDLPALPSDVSTCLEASPSAESKEIDSDDWQDYKTFECKATEVQDTHPETIDPTLSRLNEQDVALDMDVLMWEEGCFEDEDEEESDGTDREDDIYM